MVEDPLTVTLDRVRKKAEVPELNVLHLNLLGTTEKNTKNSSRISRFPGKGVTLITWLMNAAC